MNLGSHIAVAAKLEENSPAFWLGAALPDLGSIGRFRLLGVCDNRDVTRGIVLHHQTDDVFHKHPWFTQRQKRLRALLLDAGVGRGASRAIAHVGPELLLDGALLLESTGRTGLRPQIETALNSIASLQNQLGSLVPDDPQGWLQHLDQVADWGTPADYHDPDAVAQRLHRILGRRPRLRMETNDIGIAAGILRTEWPDIEATALAFVSEIASDLRAVAS